MDKMQELKLNSPLQYSFIKAITALCNSYLEKDVRDKIEFSDFDYIIRGAIFDHYCSLVLFTDGEQNKIRNIYHNNLSQEIFDNKVNICMYDFVLLSSDVCIDFNSKFDANGKYVKEHMHFEHITPKSVLFQKIKALIERKILTNSLVEDEEIAKLISNHKMMVITKKEQVLLDGWKGLTDFEVEKIKNNNVLSFLKNFTYKESEALVRLYFLHLCYQSIYNKEYQIMFDSKDKKCHSVMKFITINDDAIVKFKDNQVFIDGELQTNLDKKTLLSKIQEKRKNDKDYEFLMATDLGLCFKGDNELKKYFEDGYTKEISKYKE